MKQPRRRGYVLVVTLGLLVLSATLLVSIARTATSHALAAKRAEADLQSRWSVTSARLALLPKVDDTLSRLEQDLHRPLPTFTTSIHLAGRRVDLILSDETAKANVNMLIATGKGDAETRLRSALSGSGLTNAIRLHIVPTRNTPNDALPRFVDSFGQIFESIDPHRIVSADALAPARLITCWGTGAINVMRASRESLALAAGPYLSELQTGRLIKERDAAFAPVDEARRSLGRRAGDTTPPPRSGDAVTDLLARARIDATVRGKLALASRSTCHSLWVVLHDTGKANYFFFVADESSQNDRQVAAFAW